MGIFNFLKGGCIKPIKKRYKNDLTKNLLKGDIILHRASSKFIGSLISDFTKSPYSHAEIYIGDGWCVSAEAKGITFSDNLNKTFVDVMRLKGNLTREQRGIVLEKAYQSLAKPYDYLFIVGFPFIGPKSAARRAGDVAYICSELTAWCYKEAGIDLIPGLPEDIEAPADIANSDKLDWIGAWNKSYKKEDAELNVRHTIQGKHHWLAKIIIKLIKPFTLQAEYDKARKMKQEKIREDLKRSK
jgi:uncharacterized protein YycO